MKVNTGDATVRAMVAIAINDGTKCQIETTTDSIAS